MLNKVLHYGVYGTVRIIISFIVTKIFYRNAKLIRYPIDIRNKSAIFFGKDFVSGFNCRLEAYGDGKIFFGENCQINDYVHISSNTKVIIGHNCLIASKVYISDLNHGNYSGINQSVPDSLVVKRVLSGNPVVLGDNVWVGESVAILPGVSLGCNVIVGANSVVTKSFGENVIIAGSPAVIIKTWCSDKQEWVKNE